MFKRLVSTKRVLPVVCASVAFSFVCWRACDKNPEIKEPEAVVSAAEPSGHLKYSCVIRHIEPCQVKNLCAVFVVDVKEGSATIFTHHMIPVRDPIPAKFVKYEVKIDGDWKQLDSWYVCLSDEVPLKAGQSYNISVPIDPFSSSPASIDAPARITLEPSIVSAPFVLSEFLTKEQKVIYRQWINKAR